MLSRIKFEITPLVNKMLDQLPSEVWTSTTTTFFDPAIAGGQFVREIERRLLEAGHSRKNVSGRVFGCEEYEHQVQYALNKYKLLGNYAVTNFLEQDFNMKFDVIVGNPPYQDSRAPTLKLWHKFVERGFELVKDGGHFVFITPRSWVERPSSQLSSKIVKEVFSEHQLNWIDFRAENYFDVGEKPCAYSVEKVARYTDTKLIFSDREETINYTGQKIPLDDNDHYKISIFAKLSAISATTPTLLKSVYCDTGTVDSIDTMLAKNTISPTQSNPTDVKVYWTAAQDDKYFMQKNSIKKGIKVIINRSGHYYSSKLPDKYIRLDLSEEYGVGAGAFGITCKNKKEADNLISFLTSKLYRWYIENEKTSGFNTGITKLPKLDTSRSWSDQQVYAHFNLTQDEINQIESNVK